MLRKKKKPHKKPSRNVQLIRAMSILKILLYSKKTLTIDKLAKKFDVHPKTIKRDLIAIEKSGFKLKKGVQA